MSLFGSTMRDFDEDPFFSSHRDHMRRMERMMGNFMDPFEEMRNMMGFPALPGVSRQMNPRRDNQNRGMVPFGFGNFGFPAIGNMMSNFDHMANDPNCHSYTSSSFVTYSTGENGQPKVYQASSSTRRAPGGVRETHRAVCDSEAGLKKMAIGHHLGEKAHIVEKTKYNSGQEEENEEYVNLDEEEAETFNHQWQNHARQIRPVVVPAISHRMRERPVDERQRALPSTSRKRDHKDDSGDDKMKRKQNRGNKQ